MSATQSQPLAVRFAGIIAVLRQALGTRVGRPGKPGLPGPLLVAIWNRLGRMVNRFNRLAARLEAGTLTPPRRRPTAPRRTAAARPPPDGIMLPRGRGWLVRLVQATAVGSGYLRVLLDDPEMQALMAAAPQAGRILRPLWHMLTVAPLPPALRPPPPAPRTPTLRTPTPRTSAPRRPAQVGGPPPAEPARANLPRPHRLPPAPEVARPAGVPPAPQPA